MSEHIHKRHNRSLLLYQLVCPINRCSVLTDEVSQTLVFICKELSERYEIHFVEIGTDEKHVHFLIQSVPILSISTIAQTVKSIIVKEIFRLHPEVKERLWGGQFWSSGYYVNTVGQYASESIIQRYISEQGKSKTEYKKLHENQLRLFE